MLNEPNQELAVITGAARRIGRRIALEMAFKGYAIGLHYHQSKKEALQTAAEIEEIGAAVILLPADLCDPCAIEGMFSKISASPYRLSVLVNSAAEMQMGNLRDLTVESWDQTLTLNLRAPWLCARAAAPYMEESGGIIINISDSGARKVWGGYPAYIISKAGLETLTRLLARSLSPKIRVNGVAPGLVLPPADLAPEEWGRLVDRLPLPREGSVDDIAKAVSFLIESPYITGEILIVDGGYQLI